VAYRTIGAVFVFDIAAMLTEIESTANDPANNPSHNLINTPIDNLHFGVEQPNGAIDVHADYRLDIPFRTEPTGQPGDPNFQPPSSNTFKAYNPSEAPIGLGPADLPQGLSPQLVQPVLQIHGSERVAITSRVNRVTNKVTVSGGAFTFDLNLKAKVS